MFLYPHVRNVHKQLKDLFTATFLYEQVSPKDVYRAKLTTSNIAFKPHNERDASE